MLTIIMLHLLTILLHWQLSLSCIKNIYSCVDNIHYRIVNIQLHVSTYSCMCWQHSLSHWQHSLHVHTYSCVDNIHKKKFSGKVAFQLRVHPGACSVSSQTTQKFPNRIDPHIANEKLEWSTEYRSASVLTALLVQLQDYEDD